MSERERAWVFACMRTRTHGIRKAAAARQKSFGIDENKQRRLVTKAYSRNQCFGPRDDMYIPKICLACMGRQWHLYYISECMCVCVSQLGYTLLDIPEDMEGEKPQG